jgi:hypothetical protein
MKPLAIAPIALALALAAGAAFAGAEPVPPSAITVDFGQSSLSGAGRLIKATNVPVNTGSGITYYNADLEFQFLGDGRLAAVVSNASIAGGPAQVRTSSNFNFLPGTYKENASGCLWTLSAAGIGPDGARTSTLSKNSAQCQANLLWTSYTWSTAPGPSNPFAQGTPAQRAIYPSDAAFGLSSNGNQVRVIASGSTLNITTYYVSDGTATGSVVTFVMQ